MDPNFKIIDQSVDKVFPFTTDINEQLAQCQYMTRVSYRAEDTKSATTPAQFVQNMIDLRHYEPLEFVTIYANLEHEYFAQFKKFLKRKATDPQNAHVRYHFPISVFTLRELVEWFDSLKTGNTFKIWDNDGAADNSYWKELCKRIINDKEMASFFEIYPEVITRLVRVKWVVTTNRQIGTEISRHRSLSKNWESTRHCDYSQKRKFDNIQICNPELYSQCIQGQLSPEIKDIINDINHITEAYMRISAAGNKVQAAYLLPSCTAVKIAFAGFWDDVNKVVLVRTTNYSGLPHGDAKTLMTDVANKLKVHSLTGVYISALNTCESLRLCDVFANDNVSKQNDKREAPQKVSNAICEKILSMIPNPTEDIRRRIIEEFGDVKQNKDQEYKDSKNDATQRQTSRIKGDQGYNDSKNVILSLDDDAIDILHFLLRLSRIPRR